MFASADSDFIAGALNYVGTLYENAIKVSALVKNDITMSEQREQYRIVGSQNQSNTRYVCSFGVGGV